MHVPSGGHEAAYSLLFEAPDVGVLASDQARPFQCIVTDPYLDPEDEFQVPAAQQFPAPAQDTPARPLDPLWPGTAEIDHAVPFQCSARALRRSYPTAQQSRLLRHVTPFRAEFLDPAAGTVSRDHRVPSQRAANGKSAPEGRP
jgi:hypothetical protein